MVVLKLGLVRPIVVCFEANQLYIKFRKQSKQKKYVDVDVY